MKINEVNSLIDNLKEECGDALLNSAIISYEQGQAIARFNVDDRAASLISKYTTFIVDTIKNSDFGKIGDYYSFKLRGNIQVFILVFGEYCWSSALDTNKMPLGMIMNVLLPECIKNFKAVM